MTDSSYTFEAALFRSESNAAWHFVALPEEVTDEIDDRLGHSPVGFGGVPVEVRVGNTTWQTSIFPSSARGTYVLPVKKAVRTREGLSDGSTAGFTLRVRE